MSGKNNTGGHLLVQCLRSLGVTRGFGVPGESYLDVLDALHDNKEFIQFTLCRNEGGAAFMAEAYGKLTGSPGICLVTRGPGATNASIGVHTAMQNSTPMLLFIGQVGSTMRGREAFQEIDYHAFFGSIAKLVVEIGDVDRIPELVSRAWSRALSGRPGPVVIALPDDMLTRRSSTQPCRPVRIPEPAPGHAEIEALSARLLTAEKPLILVGGGAWNTQGSHAITHFAERHGLPIASAFRFNDLIDNHSESYVGDAGVGMRASLKAAIAESDLILAIGIRFGEMTTAEYTLLNVPNPACTLIHSHPSDAELGKIYSADIPIHAGSNQMSLALDKISLGEKHWGCRTRELRQAYLDSFALGEQDSPVDMVSVIRTVQDHLPENAIVTNGAGNFAAWPNRFLKYGAAQRLLAPQSGAMGYGLAAAVAAKVVAPDRTVLCFAGDGDFQMNLQEMGTAMQADARPVVLILNNGSYGTIRMHQERDYPDRVFGTDLHNPDFVKLAQAYGFHAERVERTDQFADAFHRAITAGNGAVLELMVSTDASTPTQTLSQIRQAGREARKS
ncbi:MAG: thiamine pyrophosphate-dependent enzyme [Granulosicoccus sp.]